MIVITVQTTNKTLEASFYGNLLIDKNKLLPTDPLSFLINCQNEYPDSEISWRQTKGVTYHRDRKIENTIRKYRVTSTFFLDWEQLLWASAFNMFVIINYKHSGIIFCGQKITQEEVDELYGQNFIPKIYINPLGQKQISVCYIH